MQIFNTCFELQLWLQPKAEKFPRPYRNTVTRRTMDAALDIAEWLNLAHVHRGRARLKALYKADVALSNLRMYLRLIHRFRWISDSQFGHASEMVEEIGRLLGGWIKQQKGQPGHRP